MKAVIMAGGRGSRLLPLTRGRPKPLVPLLDRPVMEYIVELLVTHEIRDISVTLGYLPDQIVQHFGDGSHLGANMSYSLEETPLGTAGGVKRAAAEFADTFVVMSGDALTDMNLGAAIAAHRASGAWVTIVLATVMCPRRYGVVELDEAGYVRGFVEKPETWDEGRLYTVNTGVYVLEPSVLACIPDQAPYDFGRDVFPKLLQAGVPLRGYIHDGYWSDIGTLPQYYRSQLDILEGRVHVRLPAELMHTAAVPEQTVTA